VANRLAREVGLDAIVVDIGKRRSRQQRVIQLVKRYNLSQLATRASCRIAQIVWRDARERARQVREVLGSDAAEFHFPSLVRRVEGINSPSGESLIRKLDQDQILIFGTGIIDTKILQLSRYPPLNMHTGISPHYRGSSCAFWPLHDGRFDMLGATVHECVSQVDGGAIYAVGQASLKAGDGIHAIFARCVQAGTELYIDVLKRFEELATAARTQDLTVGKEFRATDRTLGAEWRARRRLVRGELKQYLERARN